MKKSDIAMIILIAGVAVIVAFIVANSIPALKVSDKGVQVSTVDKISTNVTDPDPKVFNAQATNPTVETVIGNNAASQ